MAYLYHDKLYASHKPSRFWRLGGKEKQGVTAWRNYYRAQGSKYNNKKVIVDGMTFDSLKESRRYEELKLAEAAGAIGSLERQVRFELIPAQREPDTRGAKGGVKKGKLLERQVVYIADFVYIDLSTGEKIVEDVKGMKQGTAYEVFKLKRKLMLWVHGIRIREI